MIEIAGTTDRGVSKPFNEDRIVVQDAVICAGTVHLQASAPLCLAVLDGVSTGGHGDEAVGVASAILSERLGGSSPARTPAELCELFSAINDDLHAYARDELAGAPAATTVGGLLFGEDGEVSVFFAGDSRVYRVRAGSIEQLSHDHTIIQRLKDEDATELLAGMAQAGAHSVTRALGRNDANPVEIVESMGPARSGDLYLICSDGVSDGLSSEVLLRALTADASLDERARDLVARAKDEGGSHDNVTALLVRIYDDGLTGDATGYAEELAAGGDEGEPAMGGDSEPAERPDREGQPERKEAFDRGGLSERGDQPAPAVQGERPPREDPPAEPARQQSERPDVQEETERIMRVVIDPDATGVIDYEALERAKAAKESSEDKAAFEAWLDGDDVRPVEDDDEEAR